MNKLISFVFLIIIDASYSSDDDSFSSLKLPKNFRIGAATSSYQIEGAWNEDGKVASIWDTFTHQQNRIRDGSNADVSANSYHLYKHDVDALKYVGVSEKSIC